MFYLFSYLCDLISPFFQLSAVLVLIVKAVKVLNVYIVRQDTILTKKDRHNVYLAAVMIHSQLYKVEAPAFMNVSNLVR